jgi:hypothetical protein
MKINPKLEMHLLAAKERLLYSNRISHLEIDFGKTAAHMEYETPDGGKGLVSVFLQGDGTALVQGMPGDEFELPAGERRRG